MKKEEHGRALFVGRFQPLHRGHLDGLAQCLAQEESLIIVIGSAEDSFTATNPFTAGERIEMMESALAEISHRAEKNILIIPVRDIHDSKKWVAHVERYVPAFQRVYSGASETLTLFAAAGYETHTLEKRVAISATEVRRRMIEDEHWEELIPKAVLPYLAKIGAAERVKNLQKKP